MRHEIPDVRHELHNGTAKEPPISLTPTGHETAESLYARRPDKHLLPEEFRFVITDAAMAEALVPGDSVRINTRTTPSTGDGVLLRDGAGHVYLRYYCTRRVGQWEARAHNPAFLPLSGCMGEFECLGVVVETFAPWHRIQKIGVRHPA